MVKNEGKENKFGKKKNEDGLEMKMENKKFGKLILKNIIIDLMKRYEKRRIVIVE
jgi:hypothetical protein